MIQKTLFDKPQKPPPTDPRVDAADRPRLTGQNAAILQRLRQGPATNADLSKLALKYTSRISDLRKHLERWTLETIVSEKEFQQLPNGKLKATGIHRYQIIPMDQAVK